MLKESLVVENEKLVNIVEDLLTVLRSGKFEAGVGVYVGECISNGLDPLGLLVWYFEECDVPRNWIRPIVDMLESYYSIREVNLNGKWLYGYGRFGMACSIGNAGLIWIKIVSHPLALGLINDGHFRSSFRSNIVKVWAKKYSKKLARKLGEEMDLKNPNLGEFSRELGVSYIVSGESVDSIWLKLMDKGDDGLCRLFLYSIYWVLEAHLRGFSETMIDYKDVRSKMRSGSNESLWDRVIYLEKGD